MTNSRSLVLAFATLSILCLSSCTNIIPSFSNISPSIRNNITSLTNNELGNDLSISTEPSNNEIVSDGSVSNALSPDASTPLDSRAGLATGSSTQSSSSEESLPEIHVATGSGDTSSVDTNADSDNPITAPVQSALNGTGPSSSQDRTTRTTSGSGDFGGFQSSGNGASAVNETMTDNEDILGATESQPPDSPPSNDTSSNNGNANEISGESSSNQSDAQVHSSNYNISSTEPSAGAGITNTSTGSNSVSLTSPSHGTSLAITEDSLQASISSDPNTVTQPISPGDGQAVNIGDIGNTQNISAQVSFDRNSYSVGDTVQVTVRDGDGNVDPDSINTIQLNVRSNSDQSGIVVILTETGPNTGEFVGTFDLTDAASTTGSIKVDPSNGDKIQLLYDGSHPRARATLDGVSQPGAVEITRVLIPEGDFSEVLVGNAIELSLADGAQLAPNEATDFCLTQFAEPVTSCGGHINITMSYANGPLNGQIPSELTMFQKVGGTWINLKDFGEVRVNEDTKTVSVVTPFGPGIFTIGANIGGGGGGGGGLGIPGAGIVLDFLAPVTSEPPSTPPPPVSESPGTEIPELEGSITDQVEHTAPQPIETSLNSTTASSTGQGSSGSDALSSGGQISESNDGSSLAAKTGNITIPVPGEGNITLVYSGLISQGSLYVQPVKDKSQITALKIAKNADNEPGIIITSNNTKFKSVGTVFMIVPTDARFNDTITVTIPYNPQFAGSGDAEIRMLQYTGSDWQDVTTSTPANGRTVTGNIDVLGPVVAAVRTS